MNKNLNYLDSWKGYTSEDFILNVIDIYKLYQSRKLWQLNLLEQCKIIRKEVKGLDICEVVFILKIINANF